MYDSTEEHNKKHIKDAIEYQSCNMHWTWCTGWHQIHYDTTFFEKCPQVGQCNDLKPEFKVSHRYFHFITRLDDQLKQYVNCFRIEFLNLIISFDKSRPLKHILRQDKIVVPQSGIIFPKNLLDRRSSDQASVFFVQLCEAMLTTFALTFDEIR